MLDSKWFLVNKNITIIVISILLSILFRTSINNSGLFYIGILIAYSILFTSLVINTKYIIYPIMALIALMPDLTHNYEENNIISASIWQINLGPLTPSLIITFFLTIILIRIKSKPIPKILWVFIIYFLIICPINSILNGYFDESISRVIVDLKVPIYIVLGYLIFDNYFYKFPDRYYKVLYVFSLLLLSNFSIDLFTLLFKNVETVSSVKYLSYDTSKGLVMIFIFWGISNLVYKKRIAINSILILISLIILLAYQTRWLYISLFMGLLLILVYIKLKHRVKFLIITLLGLIIIFNFIQIYYPTILDTTKQRFSFINNNNNKTTLIDIDIARAGSIYNSTSLLKKENKILIGMGYGSWYDDSFFSMPFLTSSAFDDESLRIGKYYRVHDFIFHFLFKFGIIGILVYLYLFIKPLKTCYMKRRLINNNSLQSNVLITIIGLTPMVISYMYWSGKGLLFSSFFIVIFNGLSKKLKFPYE